MALLQQNNKNPAIYMGWYGTCENDCTDFDIGSLPIRNKIHKVYEVSAENENDGYIAFDGTISPSLDNNMQPFTKLKCGKTYIIVLKPGLGQLIISNFVTTDSSTEDLGRVVSDCKINPTPTPINPTPTPINPTPTPINPTPTPINPTPTPINPTPTPINPTPTPINPTPTPINPTPTPINPTPTPIDCCKNLEEKLEVTGMNSETINYVSVFANEDGSDDGVLCMERINSGDTPTGLLISFITDDFSNGGLNISVEGKYTGQKFRFTRHRDGKCFEGSMIFGETNVWQQIN
jgi:hypothetical protein